MFNYVYVQYFVSCWPLLMLQTLLILYESGTLVLKYEQYEAPEHIEWYTEYIEWYTEYIEWFTEYI
jgi:hypothetical protein